MGSPSYTLDVFSLGMWQTNCYLLSFPERREAVLIDAGFEPGPVLDNLARDGLKLQAILLTHGHLDHIAGVREVQTATGAPVYIHAIDAPMLTDPDRNGSGRHGLNVTAPEPDVLVEEGTPVELCGVSFDVLFVPGHTPGHVCYRLGGDLFAGDTLFAGSIGRTDFPGGSHEQLIDGIRTKILTLPPDTRVWPGHGPDTTVAQERQWNPFL